MYSIIKKDNMDNNKIPTIVIPSIDNYIEKPVLRRQRAIYPSGLSPPPLKRQTTEMYLTTPEPILRRQNSKELTFDYNENITNEKNTLHEVLSEYEKK